MKMHYFHFFFMLYAMASGQSYNTLDTIYANDQMQVALFFSAPIRQAVTGTSQMSFSFNKDRPQRIGLLKASPGKPSNLLVVDQNNHVYSFVLKYQKELSVLNYRFTEARALFQLDTLKDHPHLKSNTKLNIEEEKNAVSVAFANYLIDHQWPLLRSRKQQKLRLRLFDIQYYKDNAYLLFECSNQSKVSFSPGDIKIFLQTKQQAKRKSMQRQEMFALEKIDFPERINTGETKRFVIILPQFAIPKKWILSISLKEERGRRHLRLTSSKF